MTRKSETSSPSDVATVISIGGNNSVPRRVQHNGAAQPLIALVPMNAKEYSMRKIARIAGFATLLCLAASGGYAKTPAASKSGPTIVIVFKDGHRQVFYLSDIERVEFPPAQGAEGAIGSGLFPNHFLGKWEVGDGSGNNFYITLDDDGSAYRSLGDVHGKWVYADGEARVTWDDGNEDAIRKVGNGYQKRAFGPGKPFTGTPENVTGAHNTTPHPI